MVYNKRFWTIESIAVELDRDRRVVGRALEPFPGDSVVKGNPVYFLTTALQALGAWKRGSENLDPNYERARKDKELADRTALANAVTRGELIDRNTVDDAVTGLHVELKTRLLGVGRQVAEFGIHAESVGELDQIVTDGIRDALAILSTFSTGGLRPEDSVSSGEVAEGFEATAEVDDFPMGRSRATPKPRGQRRTRTMADE